LTPSGLLDLLNPLLVHAGVKQPRAAAHSFRRAFNHSLLVNARAYDYERRLILGHAQPDVNSIHYLNPNGADMRRTLNRVYRDAPALLEHIHSLCDPDRLAHREP
jgi:hypothetical protein